MNTQLPDNSSRDTQLVTAVRSGDTKVYDQLVTRYADTIHFIIMKIVYSEEVAKELTNDVFEKAFINIHQYEVCFPFSSWLFRIAHNHAIDHLRRKRGAVCSLLTPVKDFKSMEVESPEKMWTYLDNPEEAMIRYENAEILHKVVSELHPRYRLLLEMRYFGQYTCTEIATQLNLPVGTVKVRLFRSRKLLLEMLKNNEINCS